MNGGRESIRGIGRWASAAAEAMALIRLAWSHAETLYLLIAAKSEIRRTRAWACIPDPVMIDGMDSCLVIDMKYDMSRTPTFLVRIFESHALPREDL